MKKIFLLGIIFIIILIILIIIICYPNIEFYNDDYLYMMSYSKDWSYSEDLKELEEESCYDESYWYNSKRNISIINWDYKGFLIFKWFKVKYQKGNICETEYLLEESYIQYFLENAEIIDNEYNIDINKLIEGKTAITGNRRYPRYDNYKYIGYILDNKYMDMYISTNDDGLIIIQVGLSDEGPKYIAYK